MLKSIFYVSASFLSFYAISQNKVNIIFKDSKTQQRITGHILNTKTNETVYTNSKGKLELMVPQNQSIEYTAISNGYNNLKSWIAVDSENHLEYVVNLDPMYSKLNNAVHTQQGKFELDGYIYDDSLGLPIQQAHVSFDFDGASATTDANGYFKVTSNKIISEPTRLQKGFGDITISKQNFTTIHLKHQLLTPSAQRLFFSLKQGSQIITQQSFNGATDDKLGANRLKIEDATTQNKANKIIVPQSIVNTTCVGPTSIRVVTGMPTGNCSTLGYPVNVYSMQTYAENGIDSEWIMSWNTESIKAGTIAYRSYGGWHVNNPLSSSFDIRSNDCSQVFVMGTNSAGLAAAIATTGEYIQQGGSIARSEYSSELNNKVCAYYGSCACSDGQKGEGSGQWLCVSDAICAGHNQYGHARGMCQYGTNDWAVQQSKLYPWLISHYYNDGGIYECSTTTTICVAPSAPFTSMGTTVCPGSQKTLPITFSWGGSNASNYILSCAKYPYGPTNAVYNSNPCENSTSVTPPSTNFQTGMLYRYVTRGTNSCTLTSCESGNSNVAYFYTKPSISPSTTQSICITPSVLFSTPTRTISSPGLINYQWYLNNNVISGATTSTLVATAVGNYKVKITFSGSLAGCATANIETDAVSFVTCATTNINEVDLNMLINLFPNPSNISLINISNNSNVKIIEANVYDVQGKLILNKLQNNITQINFADDIARQVLILQLKFENNTIVYKRIVLN